MKIRKKLGALGFQKLGLKIFLTLIKISSWSSRDHRTLRFIHLTLDDFIRLLLVLMTYDLLPRRSSANRVKLKVYLLDASSNSSKSEYHWKESSKKRKKDKQLPSPSFAKSDWLCQCQTDRKNRRRPPIFKAKLFLYYI